LASFTGLGRLYSTESERPLRKYVKHSTTEQGNGAPFPEKQFERLFQGRVCAQHRVVQGEKKDDKYTRLWVCVSVCSEGGWRETNGYLIFGRIVGGARLVLGWSGQNGTRTQKRGLVRPSNMGVLEEEGSSGGMRGVQGGRDLQTLIWRKKIGVPGF